MYVDLFVLTNQNTIISKPLQKPVRDPRYVAVHLTGFLALGPQHSYEICRQRRIAIQNGMIHCQLIFPASVGALREPTLLCQDTVVPPGNGYRNRKRVRITTWSCPRSPMLSSRFHDNKSPAPPCFSLSKITRKLIRADQADSMMEEQRELMRTQ